MSNLRRSQIIQGPPGPPGVNSFSTVEASFTQPAINANVSVTLDTTEWLEAGQPVFIPVGGMYIVSSITSDTVAVLTNLGYSMNAAAGLVVPSGNKVVPGGAGGGPVGAQKGLGLLRKNVVKNSLVPSNIAHPLWNHTTSTWRAYPAPNWDFDADGGLDLVRLNFDGISNSPGGVLYTVKAPPGCTSFTFSVVYKYISGNTQFRLVLYPLTAGVVGSLQESSIVNMIADSTVRTHSVTWNVVAGNEYRIGIEANNSGQQATPAIGEVLVKPNGATGVFADDFFRIDVTPDIVWFNIWKHTVTHYFLQSPHSEVRILTDAATLCAEYWVQYGAASPGAFYSVDGVDAVQGAASASDLMVLYDTVTNLKRAGEMRPITIHQTFPNEWVPPSSNLVAPSHRDQYRKAIYISASARFEIMLPPGGMRKVLWFGDSIPAGNRSSGAVLDVALCNRKGMVRIVRRGFPGMVFSECAGGRVFNNWMSSAAIRTEVAKWFADADADILLLNAGVNDYINGVTAATFQTNLQALVQAILAIRTGQRIILVHPYRKGSEVAVGGSTLGDYRTAMTNIVTALNLPNVTSLDTTVVGWHVVNPDLLADSGQLHPDQVGTHRDARQILIALGAAA